MKLNEMNTELKNGSHSLKSDKYIMIKESDFIKLRKAGLELDKMVENSVDRDQNKKASDKLFSVINKYDYEVNKKVVVSEWEKGFREGANHSFSFLNDGADLSDKFVKKEISDLDNELKNRIKIATSKNKVSSVLNEK